MVNYMWLYQEFNLKITFWFWLKMVKLMKTLIPKTLYIKKFLHNLQSIYIIYLYLFFNIICIYFFVYILTLFVYFIICNLICIYFIIFNLICVYIFCIYFII